MWRNSDGVNTQRAPTARYGRAGDPASAKSTRLVDTPSHLVREPAEELV